MPGSDYTMVTVSVFRNQSAINSCHDLVERLETVQVSPWLIIGHIFACHWGWGQEIITHGYRRNFKAYARVRVSVCLPCS